MPVYNFIILLIIHFSLAGCCLFLPSSRLRQRKEYLLPVLVVPFFGPFIAITIHVLFFLNTHNMKTLELESLHADNDIFWAAFANPNEDTDAVPLEEAILLNDVHTRRKAVLSTFRGNSFQYLDILMIARNNEDVDTTHYANIQITKIQREYQLQIQKYAADFEKNPNNPELLNQYIDLLDTYLQSPLPEKSILLHQREVFADLLDRKLALAPNDKETLMKKLRNCTQIGEDYRAAVKVIDRLKEDWPDDEEVWIETLRAAVNWKDTARVQETIQAMKTQKIRWTRWGREQVSLWMQP